MKIELKPLEGKKQEVTVTLNRRKYSAVVEYDAENGFGVTDYEREIDRDMVMFALEAKTAGILEENAKRAITDSDIKNMSLEIFRDKGSRGRDTTFRATIGDHMFYAYGEYESKNVYAIEHGDDSLSVAAVALALEMYYLGRIRRIPNPIF